MGCCQSAPVRLRRSQRSQRSRTEPVQIVVEGVSEQSEGRGYKELWNNPECLFQRRDVSRCFKGAEGEEQQGMRGREKGQEKIVLIMENQQTKNSSTEFQSNK